MNDDKVYIFDTTLRDGEQSAGISFTREDKIEIAKQLAKLNVDIIEAGFPATSPGDLDAVASIAREVKGPVIAGLARADVPRLTVMLLGVALCILAAASLVGAPPSVRSRASCRRPSSSGP